MRGPALALDGLSVVWAEQLEPGDLAAHAPTATGQRTLSSDAQYSVWVEITAARAVDEVCFVDGVHPNGDRFSQRIERDAKVLVKPRPAPAAPEAGDRS